MSQTMFKKYGRWLCFFTLTLLFVAPPSSVAQGFLSGKSTAHRRASVAHHVASAHSTWGCDPFSRCGK